MKGMGLPHFDVLIIISASRFTENDDKLIVNICNLEVPPPIFLIRSKFDIDMQNEVRDREDESGEWETLSKQDKEDIRDMIEETLINSAEKELKNSYQLIKSRLFVLSSSEPVLTLDHWLQLQEKVMVELSDNRHMSKSFMDKVRKLYGGFREKIYEAKSKMFDSPSNQKSKQSRSSAENFSPKSATISDINDGGLSTRAKSMKLSKNSGKSDNYFNVNFTTNQAANFVLKFTESVELVDVIENYNINGALFLELCEWADGDLKQELGLSKLDCRRLILAVKEARNLIN